MRGRWSGQLWAVLVLPLLLAAWPGKPVVAQGVGPSERLVLALYCADFSGRPGPVLGVMCPLICMFRPMRLRQHGTSARRDAGIDGLIQTWRRAVGSRQPYCSQLPHFARATGRRRSHGGCSG